MPKPSPSAKAAAQGKGSESPAAAPSPRKSASASPPQQQRQQAATNTTAAAVSSPSPTTAKKASSPSYSSLSSPLPPLPSSSAAQPPVFFDKSVIKRGMTISIVAPSVMILINSYDVPRVFLVWLLTFLGVIEWTAMKRHLKVALLYQEWWNGQHGGNAPLLQQQQQQQQQQPVEEYPYPVAKTNLFIICKSAACSAASIAAFISTEAFGLSIACYFIFWVTFTLMGQNKAEMNVENAMRKMRNNDSLCSSGGSNNSSRSSSANRSGSGNNSNHNNKEATPSSSLLNDDPLTIITPNMTPAQVFHQKELAVIATRYTTELFLSFCLEYFGFIWIMGLSHGLLLDRLLPHNGQGHIIMMMVLISNWCNDISALIIGKKLKGRTSPLYPKISPNKSREGAIAGVLANGISFAILFFCFTEFSSVDSPIRGGGFGLDASSPSASSSSLTSYIPQPLVDSVRSTVVTVAGVVLPLGDTVGNAVADGVQLIRVELFRKPFGIQKNTLPTTATTTTPYAARGHYWGEDYIHPCLSFFLVGLVLGVAGVVGDLLQSLFKRSAKIKDTGSIFPGHGGVLDRIDGLLICYPVAFWIMWTFLHISSLV